MNTPSPPVVIVDVRVPFARRLCCSRSAGEYHLLAHRLAAAKCRCAGSPVSHRLLGDARRQARLQLLADLLSGPLFDRVRPPRLANLIDRFSLVGFRSYASPGSLPPLDRCIAPSHWRATGSKIAA